MPRREQSRIRCAGGVVHDHEGRLLLVRRRDPPGQGLWSLPGGRVEPGETDAEAVAREVAEETGLSVTVGRLAGTVLRPSPAGVFEIHDHLCQVESGELVAGDDATDALWATAAILATLDRESMLTEGLVAALRSWNCLPRS